MMYKPIALTLAALALAMLPAVAANAIEYGDPLVGNAFVTGYDGWTDTTTAVATGSPWPNWGVLLTDDKCLSESSDGRVSTSSTANSGLCKSLNLVNMSYTTPENTVENPAGYHLKATLSTYDNDGFGLLFGYVDNDNYFRVAFRQQPNGNLGYMAGTSVQKVVNGTVTQLGTSNAFIPAVDNTQFNVDVAVNGSSWAISVNGTPLTALSGTESGSTLLTTGNRYGVHSWYQRIQDITTIPANVHARGTMAHSITITDANEGVIKTHAFADALPVNWKGLTMKNAVGNDGIGAGGTNMAGRMRGNFHQDFRHGTIVDDTDASVWATTSAPNVDFIGPAVVVDEPGSLDWTDYEMTVRLRSVDNDGIGLLVRAMDDDTFYRINFSSQSMTASNMYERAPQGMSIQKCLDGVWSELFRDDQSSPTSPIFTYTPGTAFDVKATVVGNTITVEVTQGATVYQYGTVTDTDDPILAGSVGLTNWGCGAAGSGVEYSAYGGIEGHALVTYVPEPSTFVLLSLMALCGMGIRRRS